MPESSAICAVRLQTYRWLRRFLRWIPDHVMRSQRTLPGMTVGCTNKNRYIRVNITDTGIQVR